MNPHKGDALTVEKRMQLSRGLLGEDPEPRGWGRKIFQVPPLDDNSRASNIAFLLK